MFFTLLNLCKVRDPSRSARCLPFAQCLLFVLILVMPPDKDNEFVGEKRVKDNQVRKHLDPIRGFSLKAVRCVDVNPQSYARVRGRIYWRAHSGSLQDLFWIQSRVSLQEHPLADVFGAEGNPYGMASLGKMAV